MAKRARDESPDSDTCNSSEGKSEKHRLLSQVVRPQDCRSVSPPRVIEDRTSSWKDDDRKSDKKESTRRRDDHTIRERISSGDKQREHTVETVESSRSRESDSATHHVSDDREGLTARHEQNKKKNKGQRKSQKKNKRDDECGSKKYIAEPLVEETVLSPRKAAKKKNVEKKRKRSKDDSDASDEEVVPPAKKWKGPRTPPVTVKEESVEDVSEKSAEGNAQGGGDVVFSDWSDEDVPDREESIISDKSVEDSRRKVQKAEVEKIEAPTVADNRPCKTDEHKRSSSLGSNRSRTSSRLRSPSNESTHRSGDDQSGGRKLQLGTARDGQKYRNIEPCERKSRIDQLKRGEPSRSTSSDRQDSRSHSSRRSSPESDRQGRSRTGSFESREKLQDSERDRDRERRERREWERDGEHRDWAKSRDRNKDKRREVLKEKQKPPAEVPDKDKERTLEAVSMLEQTRVEPRPGRETEKQLEQNESAAAVTCERDVKEPVKESENEEVHNDEPVDNVEVGEQDGKVDDAQSSMSGACEEYEPISDDELDEILNDDAGKREENQDEEKVSDPMDVIDVDWSSLLPKQPKEPKEPGAALLKFTPGAILLRAGISKRLAGAELFAKVNETCRAAINNSKDNIFEDELGALNMAAIQRKEERAHLLSNLGPCCKALCSRRDLAIRKQLVRNEKGASKHMYTNQPVVDNDLLRSSLRLFKRKALCHGHIQEKSDDSKISRPKVKQEVCVS